MFENETVLNEMDINQSFDNRFEARIQTGKILVLPVSSRHWSAVHLTD